MSSSDQDNKHRNREIAANEAKREMVSNVRVSTWAIATAVVVGVIMFWIVWAWLLTMPMSAVIAALAYLVLSRRI